MARNTKLVPSSTSRRERLALLRLRRRAVGQVFLQENGGICQPEPVNALLHIAHGEQPSLLPGQGPENAVLHLVAVLVFVHHHLPVTGGDLLCQLRGPSLAVGQQVDGIVLLVGKVHHVAPDLLRLIMQGKLCRQAQQGQHGRGHLPQILQQLRLRHRKDRLNVLQRLFGLLQHRLGPLPAGGVLLPLGHAHPPEGRHALGKAVPAAGGLVPQGLQVLGHLQKPVTVGLVHGGIVRHILHGPGQPLGPEVRPAQGVLHEILAAAVVRQLLGGDLPALPQLLQPPQGVRVALGLFVEVQHQGLQRPVIPSGSQGLRQLAGVAVLLDVGVKILQYPVQHPPPQQHGLLFVQHPEIRGQAVLLHRGQQVHVLAEQSGAEGVHGFDVRLIHPQHLPPQVAVPGPVRHPAGQLLGDLAPQLRRCGLGIGDDQEVVHLTALLLHIGKQALHQNLRLAGACGGRHQKASAPVIYGCFLLRRQRHVLPSFPFSASTNCQNSSGFTVLI